MKKEYPIPDYYTQNNNTISSYILQVPPGGSRVILEEGRLEVGIYIIVSVLEFMIYLKY